MKQSHDTPKRYTFTDYTDDVRDNLIGNPEKYNQDEKYVRRRKVAGTLGLMAVGVGIGVGGFMAAKHDKSFGQPEGPMEIPTNQHYSGDDSASIYDDNTVTLKSERE